MVSITVNGWDTIIATFENLRAGTPRAIMRALNRAIASARTVETRAVSADTGIKQAKVRAALSMSNASPSKLTATLSVGRQIPLINFRAKGRMPSRGKGDGVTFSMAGGGQGRIPNAFIATMRSGHKGVFERVGVSGRKSHGAWSENLPIRQLFGSIEPGFIKHQVEAVARAEEIFISNFEREMTGAGSGTPIPNDPGTTEVGAE